MAKKLSKKKSFFDSLLSFRKILVYSIVITFVLFTYKSSNITSKSVEGANTAATNYDIISDSQYETLKDTKSVNNYPRYVYLRLWKDDGDSKREENEKTCPEKSYTISVNGSNKSITQKPNCKQTKVDVYECNKIVFKTQFKNYTVSGIEYTDKYGITHSLKGKSKISFCGGEYFEGGWSREISFGLKPK